MSAPSSGGAGPRSSGGIGAAMLRREDDRFLRGKGRYLADIDVPRALHAVFVRSPHAHADIRAINTAPALAMAGVVAVWTGADVSRHATTLRMAPPIEGLKPLDVPPFPVDKVRFVGDLVAVVVAERPDIARDAAEQVAVTYGQRSAAPGMAEAGEPVDPGLPTNLVSHQTFTNGDLRAAFAKADRIVESRFAQGRQTHMPLEPRSIVAEWDEGRRHLTVRTGNQAPHPLRSALAARLGLAESAVTVVSPDMGGGFGQKIALLREELTVAALAMALGRPVRWQEERGENLIASLHAREEALVTRAAVTSDGHILGLEAFMEADVGAYCFFPANYMARVVALILPGPYRIPAYAYDVKVYLSNKCPSGPMRAPMASASWVMEGTIDRIAAELGLDPVTVRRKNTVRDADLPFTTITGETYVDVTPAQTLDAAVKALGYADRRAEQARAGRAGRLLGIGICTVVEPTTYGSAFYKNAGIAGSGHETATVRIEPSGAILVSCGIMGSGQGYETTLAQCAAEGLGARFEDIAVRIGNTDEAPYGMGSRGARGAAAGGGVVLIAARRMREKLLKLAAHLLGLNSPESLAIADGKVLRLVDGAWTATDHSIASLARIAHLDPLRLPEGMEPGLHLTAAHDPPAMTYANATHACLVEIDPASGVVKVLRYLVAHDCGVEINPAIVAGQVHGAVAMGLSGASMECCAYDRDGQALAGSLMDYAVARATDIPPVEIIAVNRPNRLTPGGMKGMSEGGVMGASGALANAINDALGRIGRSVTQQPFTPEAIWREVHQVKPAPQG